MSVTTNIIDISKININKKYSRISKIHKYWARKPWFIIDQYIKKYSSANDWVLDAFMGSGSTGLEAIINNRNFIGYDLNPFSVFLTNKTLEINYDRDCFIEEFNILKKNIKPLIMRHYYLGNNRYIRYKIVGKDNKKKYCQVTDNFDFKDKQYDNSDNEKNNQIKSKKIYFPDRKFPKKFYKDRFSYKGVSKVSDMFTKRNLSCLAILRDSINKYKFINSDLFYLALSNSLLHVSKLKSENVRPLSVNNYWMPNDFIEENVWWRFENRFKNILLAKSSVLDRYKDLNIGIIGNYILYNKSALSLEEVAKESIDYIFTDPPYGDAIQYSELSFIWNTWLEKEFDIEEEVIINPVQNKNEETFNNQIERFIDKSWEVLKQEKYMTLCFQNKNINLWLEVAKVIQNKGFNLVDISVYDVLGNPYNKSWSTFSPKSDLYITFQKVKKNKQKKLLKKSIRIEKIINNLIDKVDIKNYSIGSIYNSFIVELIRLSFIYQEIITPKKFDIKKLIKLIESESNSGNI